MSCNFICAVHVLSFGGRARQASRLTRQSNLIFCVHRLIYSNENKNSAAFQNEPICCCAFVCALAISFLSSLGERDLFSNLCVGKLAVCFLTFVLVSSDCIIMLYGVAHTH